MSAPPLRRMTGLALALCAVSAAALLATAAPAMAGSCPNEEFRTGPGANLPDCRAYELVTPPFKEASRVGILRAVDLPEGMTGISASGLHVDVVSYGDFGDAPSGESDNTYELTRTESGWTETDIDLPQAQFPESKPIDTTPEMGEDLYEARATEQSLKAKDFWLREADGALLDIGPFEPPADTEGPSSGAGYGIIYLGGGGGFVAASTDLSHVVFTSPVSWPGDEAYGPAEQYPRYGATYGSLYEYAVGRSGPPVPIGVEPDGSPCAASYFGISASGSTVFFACAGALFARIDNGEAGAHTVAISEPSVTDCSACDLKEFEQIPAESERLKREKEKNEITEAEYNEEITRLEGLKAIFVGSSEDGSKVFFTTQQELLPGQSTDNLYEYDFDAEAGHRVVLVSSGSSTPEVQGVAAISQDGSHLYFYAKAVLSAAPSADAQGDNAHGEPVSSGAVAQSGADNLYVHDTETGQTAFIETGGVGNTSVTPNGQFLVFTSTADLTPGDTSTAGQIFEYDAQTGALVRVSIGQGGFNDNGNTSCVPNTNAPGSGRCLNDASFPEESRSTRQAVEPHVVSNDGSYVVFQSPDGLTPGALNGIVRTGGEGQQYGLNNVYEFHDGNVYLISDGLDTSSVENGSAVQLEGISSSGEDIYFRTADQLVPQDLDTEVDIYDARIDGGFPAPVSLLPSCSGDACQGELSSAPVLLSPGSEFQAGGNPPLTGSEPAPAAKPKSKPAKCRQGFVKKKTKCVKAKSTKKAKKSTKGKR